MEKSGASFFYQADGLGSITEITDAFGVAKQHYTYSSFGKIESQTDANFIQPYTFSAREYDPETNFHFYRARFYDSNTGRFLAVDPILSLSIIDRFAGGSPSGRPVWRLPGLLKEPGRLHSFTYVGSNPVTLVDPFGLISVKCLAARAYEFTKCLAASYKSPNAPGIGLPQLIRGYTGPS